ncbi:hypothetical protein SLA2020_501190 [Shorea laevis]
MYESSLNVGVQNSNSNLMAADGKFERIDGIEAVEKEADSIGTKKKGKRRLNARSNVAKGPMGQHGIGPQKDEGNDSNEAKACDPNKENSHDGSESELKSNGDLEFSNS